MKGYQLINAFSLIEKCIPIKLESVQEGADFI
jgi:hypothetical protein